jgi:hypothetical protein
MKDKIVTIHRDKNKKIYKLALHIPKEHWDAIDLKNGQPKIYYEKVGPLFLFCTSDSFLLRVRDIVEAGVKTVKGAVMSACGKKRKFPNSICERLNVLGSIKLNLVQKYSNFLEVNENKLTGKFNFNYAPVLENTSCGNNFVSHIGFNQNL